MASFAGNQVFRIRCGRHVFFLKLADHAELQCEVAVLELLARRGVPVPRVEARDLDAHDAVHPYVILRDVGGEPLTGDEPEFARCGMFLRAVHDVRLEGFGCLVGSADDLRGESPSWAAAIRYRIGNLGPAVDAGLVPGELVARARAALSDREPLFAAVGQARLLHGDFHPRHVYARHGSISGIIDWGDASVGDPVYDLGRVLHSGTLARDVAFGRELVQAVLATYGDAPWVDGDLDVKLLLYACVFVLWSMQGEYSGGAPWPAWWPPQCGALSSMLDALDQA